MANQAARTLIHFEVQVLRGTRWTIELALEDGQLALERAQQLLHQPEIDGIKVWKEIHDPTTGKSASRVVLCELKPRTKPKGRWALRVRRPVEAADEPEPRRRRVAAPPPRAADWPIACLSIGGACTALVALAVLAAID